MAFDADVIAEIIGVAKKAKIEPEALLAVTEVESGGKAFATVNGEKKPLILYEYHVFYRNLPVAKRDEAMRRNLARKRWGDLPYKRSMAARYAQLDKAIEIDKQAAYAACSWGVGQVLGENATWLGYKNPQALAKTAMKSVSGQVEVMLRFIEKAGLMDELKRRDWEGFARRYNGSGQVPKYSRLMRNAYRKHMKGKTPPEVEFDLDDTVLRIGSEGEEVATLQRVLRSLGHHLVIDGDFGPATRRMVMTFQSEAGLTADGIVGPATWARIEAMTGRDLDEFL